MTCLLKHPEVATRSCDECRKWLFRDDDGPNGAWKKGDLAMRGGQPIPRVLPPNCAACPKESPEQAHLHELSVRNMQAVEFYFTTRAMSGMNLTDRQKHDATIQRNMAIIDRILKPHEAEQAALAAVAPLLMCTVARGAKK